jgi:hypothetical protein
MTERQKYKKEARDFLSPIQNSQYENMQMTYIDEKISHDEAAYAYGR